MVLAVVTVPTDPTVDISTNSDFVRLLVGFTTRSGQPRVDSVDLTHLEMQARNHQKFTAVLVGQVSCC